MTFLLKWPPFKGTFVRFRGCTVSNWMADHISPASNVLKMAGSWQRPQGFFNYGSTRRKRSKTWGWCHNGRLLHKYPPNGDSYWCSILERKEHPTKTNPTMVEAEQMPCREEFPFQNYHFWSKMGCEVAAFISVTPLKTNGWNLKITSFFPIQRKINTTQAFIWFPVNSFCRWKQKLRLVLNHGWLDTLTP